MNNLDTRLSRITDPKARKPNKMTRSRKHKKSKVVIEDVPVRSGWCYDRGQETVIVVKIWGVVGMVKVVGLKGLAESKDRPSTTYALLKYIPHFESKVGVKSPRKRLE